MTKILDTLDELTTSRESSTFESKTYVLGQNSKVIKHNGFGVEIAANMKKEDAKYFLALHNNYPALSDYIRRAEGLVEELRVEKEKRPCNKHGFMDVDVHWPNCSLMTGCTRFQGVAIQTVDALLAKYGFND